MSGEEDTYNVENDFDSERPSLGRRLAETVAMFVILLGMAFLGYTLHVPPPPPPPIKFNPCVAMPPKRPKIVVLVEPTMVPYTDEEGTSMAGMMFVVEPKSITDFFEYVTIVERSAERAAASCVAPIDAKDDGPVDQPAQKIHVNPIPYHDPTPGPV